MSDNDKAKVDELLAEIRRGYCCLEISVNRIRSGRGSVLEALPYDRNTMERMLRAMDQIDAIDPTVITTLDALIAASAAADAIDPTVLAAGGAAT